MTSDWDLLPVDKLYVYVWKMTKQQELKKPQSPNGNLQGMWFHIIGLVALEECYKFYHTEKTTTDKIGEWSEGMTDQIWLMEARKIHSGKDLE